MRLSIIAWALASAITAILACVMQTHFARPVVAEVSSESATADGSGMFGAATA